MKIAALLDESGRASSPQAGGTIYVYQREADNWVASRRTQFAAGEFTTMSDLRNHLTEVAEWLDDCKVLAGRAANGYYRVAFGSLGVALWAVRGRPEDFVEQIEQYYRRAAALAAQEQQPEPSATIEPIPERAGHYRVDLRGVMGVAGAHSSRRVLLPFLQSASFSRLEITCDHVPRWFATELPQLDLGATEESQAGFTRVHVYPIGPTQRRAGTGRRLLELRPVAAAGSTVPAGAVDGDCCRRGSRS